MKKLLTVLLLAVGICSCSQMPISNEPEPDTLMVRIKNLTTLHHPGGFGIAATRPPENIYVLELRKRYSEEELFTMTLHGDNANLRILAFRALCMTNFNHAIDLACSDFDDNELVEYFAGCLVYTYTVHEVMVVIADYYYWRLHYERLDRL